MKFDRIHIELTNNCNFSCVFCPDSVMERKRGTMDITLFKSIVDEISNDALTDTIMLHVMGEPLMYPSIEEAIEYAHSKNLKVCLTTNGSLMTKDLVDRLIHISPEHIIFSVQTPTSESFRLRRSHEKFENYMETVISSISAILNSGTVTKVTLSFLTTPFKEYLLPGFNKSVIDDHTDLWEFSYPWLINISKEVKNNELRSKLEDSIRSAGTKIKKLNLLGWNQIGLSDNFTLETRVLGDWVRNGKIKNAVFGACEGLTKHFGILWNGDMVFCCVDFDGNTVFGNIKDIPIKEAFKGADLKKVLNGFKKLRILHPYCKKCMGGRNFLRSLIRQVGSVIYFRLYREVLKNKRARIYD